MTAELKHAIAQAVAALHDGQLIGYPTESVYGFGCDPFNRAAVQALFQFKARKNQCAFILIACDAQQIQHLLDASLDATALERLEAPTDCPTTWVCPASTKTPAWLLGPKQTIALRITQHPIASALCRQAGQAIISSSANISGQPAATCFSDMTPFSDHLAVTIDAPCGDANKPSTVIDLITQHIYRA